LKRPYRIHITGFALFLVLSCLRLNAVNWLSSDEDLISIRPKPPEDRRITMTRAQLILVRTVSQFVLPLLVVIAGTMVWWKRR